MCVSMVGNKDGNSSSPLPPTLSSFFLLLFPCVYPFLLAPFIEKTVPSLVELYWHFCQIATDQESEHECLKSQVCFIDLT